MTGESPLGKPTVYPRRYAPEVLFAIARADNRRQLGIRDRLPFGGEDVWTAWDLGWLEPGGKPVVAVARLRVPASSACLIESKSLKLYLDSLAMTTFDGMDEVTATLARDLSRTCEAAVEVSLTPPSSRPERLSVFPGTNIDGADAVCDLYRVEPALLCNAGDDIVTEVLHSHLLRSLCPVTGQPDIGSILIEYRGPSIDHGALLRYLVSYRMHSDFHENCVERIFVDLKTRCATTELSVYACFNRRGGLDINPYRSDGGGRAPELRLWRQ